MDFHLGGGSGLTEIPGELPGFREDLTFKSAFVFRVSHHDMGPAVLAYMKPEVIGGGDMKSQFFVFATASSNQYFVPVNDNSSKPLLRTFDRVGLTLLAGFGFTRGT